MSRTITCDGCGDDRRIAPGGLPEGWTTGGTGDFCRRCVRPAAMAYGISFDFDCQGDPPHVEIREEGGMGSAVLEVHEVPVCTHPSGWSWDDDDWEPGPFALRVLALLNSAHAHHLGPFRWTIDGAYLRREDGRFLKDKGGGQWKGDDDKWYGGPEAFDAAHPRGETP